MLRVSGFIASLYASRRNLAPKHRREASRNAIKQETRSLASKPRTEA
ncbi:MAG: hypothetical protein VSS75_024255 [Candidatus Parabeggiatoa sp.]|nr:hypothetical protein [Candidatus Parabeggiatoa sp.]